MTAKKTRSLYWHISTTNKVNQIQVQVNAVCVDDESMEWSAPAVSSTSSYTTPHIMVLFLKRSMNLNAASLNMESLSVTIDDTNAAWSLINSVRRKGTPVENNP